MAWMNTIEDLGNVAELNLCKSCFQKYKMIIEPTIRDWLSKPLEDWRDIESDINEMVMITKGVFKDEIKFLYIAEVPYFKWDEIDEWELIKFLKHNYSIDWIKIAKIKRWKDNIKLFTETNELLLSLNGDKTKVILKIDGVITDELIVNTEKNQKIYKKDKKGSNYPLGEEIKWENFQKIKNKQFAKKLDTLHEKGILRDYSYRVLKEANEVRNKIHDQSFGYALFSEQDLILFHEASLVTYKILEAINYERGKDIPPVLESISNNLKNEAEEHAKQCLLKLN